MIVFNDQFAFTINTSHHERLVKTWERLSSILDFMGPDEYTTIVPLVEGVEEDLKAVVEDIEEIAEAKLKGGEELTHPEADKPTKDTNPQEVLTVVGELDGLGYAIEEVQAVYAELRKNTGLEQLPVSQQVEEGVLNDTGIT